MLTLHGHPLSSFCMKVAVALYENATQFRMEILQPGDSVSRDRLLALWPLGKMPVLRDEARGETVPESSAIVEYLDLHYPGPMPLIPRDPDLAWRARLAERIFDLHLQVPMQLIVGDRLRSEETKEPMGVAQARRQLATALDVVEARLADGPWSLGDSFSVADCAAAPALFYVDKVLPFQATHPAAWAYLERLKVRPSFARTLEEAEPFFALFPAAE